MTEARAALLETFRWQAGHADVRRVFANADAFAAVVAGLVEPWRDRGVTRVVGIESRGFLLGGAAALALGVGFVAVRKADGLLPGPKVTTTSDLDYRRQRHRLRMQTVLQHDGVMSTVVELLKRPLYGVGQAAALLGVKRADTLRRWLDGYTRGGRTYPPIIRIEPSGDDVLTWGEFVEARYLAGLRVDGASLQHLRQVVDALRESYGAYPLANAKPFVDGRDVVMRLQQRLDVPANVQLVVVRNGQIKLSAAAQDFVDHLEYQDDLASALRPAGPSSPVVIDPSRGFGMPSLVGRNVRTEILAELSIAGESNEAIARAYDLTTDQVEAALRFELQVARNSAA